MIFNLNNEYEIPKFEEYVNKLCEQKAIVELKKKLPYRSTQQNRYFYLILSWFACETGYSVDEIKVDIFKRICNKAIFERYRENKHGEKIKYLRSSSDLDTLEMTTAIDRFRNYASAQAGIYLPSPNESQFLTYIEQEIERNKEFI